jgi:nitrite reductase/ring-hydroxylating ferredoxin subunit
VEIVVTNRSKLRPTEARAFSVGGRDVLLCEVDGEVYALDAICTHEELPLDGAEVDEGILECPWHGARYEVRTGKVRSLPATIPLRTYPTRVDDDDNVYVTLPG